MIKTREFSLPFDCNNCMLADLCSKKSESENLIEEVRNAIENNKFTPIDIKIGCRFFKETRDIDD